MDTPDFKAGVTAVVDALAKLRSEYLADWRDKLRGGQIDRTAADRMGTLDFLLSDLVRAGLVDQKTFDRITYHDPGDEKRRAEMADFELSYCRSLQPKP